MAEHGSSISPRKGAGEGECFRAGFPLPIAPAFDDGQGWFGGQPTAFWQSAGAFDPGWPKWRWAARQCVKRSPQ
jgi:hypothetical protein